MLISHIDLLRNRSFYIDDVIIYSEQVLIALRGKFTGINIDTVDTVDHSHIVDTGEYMFSVSRNPL